MANIQDIQQNGTTADANGVMANTYEIFTNIDNTNIAASAGIVFSKLDSTTVASVGTAQNFLLKTLTAPVFSGSITGTYTLAGTPTFSGTIAGTPTFSGALTFSGGIIGDVAFDTNTLFVDAANNRVYVGAASASSLNGSLEATSAAGGTSVFVGRSTDAGAAGPFLTLLHDSASPSMNDEVAAIRLMGRDSAANAESYGRMSAIIDDPTNGSEDSRLVFNVLRGGSAAEALQLTGNGALFPSQDPPAVNQATRQSIGKGWALGNSIGSGALTATYNVSGFTRLGTGYMRLTWNTPFGSANYPVVASADGNGVLGTTLFATVVFRSTTTCEIKIYDAAGTLTDNWFSVIAMGDQ